MKGISRGDDTQQFDVRDLQDCSCSKEKPSRSVAYFCHILSLQVIRVDGFFMQRHFIH